MSRERTDRSEGFWLAHARAGGFTAIAAIVGLSRQAVHKWKYVPEVRVDTLSAALGVTPAELRLGWERHSRRAMRALERVS